MNFNLVSSILKGAWAMDEFAALSYAPLLNHLFGNSPVAFEFDKNNFVAKSISDDVNNSTPIDQAPSGSIAVIPLSGPLMKNDQECGPIGMATIGKIIKQADNNPNIKGIILNIDSPGGTVDGTASLSDIIKATKKPIVAFADGMMASAALWIGAACDEIIASGNKTQVGSIGVLISFADMQPALEKLGVQFHSITADQSSEKTKMHEDVRQGNYDQIKSEMLNPLAADFINHIKATRPNVSADQLTGKVFFAENVLGSLVDSIGTMDHAIERINALIENQTPSVINNKLPMKSFLAINTLLGTELASDEDGVYLNEDQLKQIDAAITLGTSNASALEEATTAQQNAEVELANANASIETLTAELAELRNAAGDTTAVAVTTKDKSTATGSKNVVSESKSFTENLNAIAEEFGI